MKRKIFRGSLAALMAMIILIVPLLSVAAVATEEKCPLIWVHGFMGSTIYDDVDDPDSLKSWPPSGDEFTTAAKETVPALAEFALTGDWDDFANSMGKITAKLFERAMNNPDGSVKEGSGVRFEYPSKDQIKADSEVSFKYDWREDPLTIAAQLSDFIDYVLEASGCDKVALSCHSFGGVVTLSYFTLYGCEKVKTVVFNSTAIYGETYTGELMSGQLHLNSSDALVNYLSYAVQGTEYENTVDEVLNLLNENGLLNSLTDLLNTVAENVQNQVCAQSIVPLFGGWLAVWAMIPDEYLDASMDYVFNNFYDDSNEDYAVLKEKIEAYNNTVRCKKTETLQKVNEECNVYVIARYGYSSLPITPSADNIGDGIIDVKYASFGATAADYGSTLENVTSDEKYISPDKTIDASTCLFPEQTWFVKNMKHADDNESLKEMMRTFAKYDGQGTVETFDQYPRYTIYNGETISPDESVSQNSTFFDTLRLIINEIFNLVKMLIKKIK